MRKIIIKKRNSDWIAFLKDNDAIWGCGKSWETAVGVLVSAHKEVFGIASIDEEPN